MERLECVIIPLIRNIMAENVGADSGRRDGERGSEGARERGWWGGEGGEEKTGITSASGGVIERERELEENRKRRLID
jgi:hypothetical protein